MVGEEKYGTKAIIALLADVKNKISDIEENAINKEDFKELTDKVTALEEQLDTKEDIFSPGEGLEMTEDRILNITLDLEIFWVNSTVPDTPPVGKSNKILLVPNPSSTDEGNYYTEYIWVVDTEHPDGHYEELGTYKSDVDLSIYQTKTDNNLQTTNKTIVGAINEINNKNTVYTIIPTLTADYTIPANATTREYIYEISIGATTYNVTAAEGIKWIDNNLPLVEANSKLIVSVVNNIAVWGTVYE